MVMSQDESIALRAEDLILFEDRIKQTLTHFFPHTAGSIYFPQALPQGMRTDAGQYTYRSVPEEAKLLIPLISHGRCLGVYMAKGVDMPMSSGTMPDLVSLLSLVLENIRLEKLSRVDRLTGLADKGTFLSTVTRKIQSGQERTDTGIPYYMDGAGSGITAHFTVILLNIDRFHRLSLSSGYAFANAVLKAVARTIDTLCPQQGLASRVQDDEFAVLLPDYSPKKTRTLVEEMRATVQDLEFTCPISRQALRLSCRTGSVHYPQNILGSELRLPALEQSHLLLDKARRCLQAAKKLGGSRGFAYADLVISGGSIREAISTERVAVDIGSFDRAEEGQRFAITPAQAAPRDAAAEPAAPKGELILIEVTRNESIGEILFLTDPTRPVAAGDRLLLQSSAASEDDIGHHGHSSSPVRNGWPLDLRRFLEKWRTMWGRSDAFCLLLCRPEQTQALGARDQTDAPCLDHTLAEAIGPLLEDRDACLGTYGSDSLIAAVNGLGPEDGRRLAQDMQAAARQRTGCDVRIGVAFYPCLDSPRFESLANCRKALEHALLLPEPGVALFDSLTLTISGDRLFAQEDLAGARQEYTRALILDEGNSLARNSLGICCARVGQLSQSCREFQVILDREPDNLMALYNFGCAKARIGDTDIARTCFEKCLQQDPEHAFSLLRLGKLAEDDGAREEAETFYRRALQTTSGEGSASKALGRLSMLENDSEEARSHLHRALTINPQDAEAIYLLAKLYHDEEENPELTERLTRKALELRPDFGDCARLLEAILHRRGLENQAGAGAAGLAPGKAAST
jgi:diguanylate cyclase (GGDEF)-like protein